eukprot:GEMP01027683.1.p1 GENE.GEMP01027683.1~~GEMP01027683.1.p1  ORF type:complete len:586 (+),score=178.12 GEMP01027683.1:86-1843(+)
MFMTTRVPRSLDRLNKSARVCNLRAALWRHGSATPRQYARTVTTTQSSPLDAQNSVDWQAALRVLQAHSGTASSVSVDMYMECIGQLAHGRKWQHCVKVLRDFEQAHGDKVPVKAYNVVMSACARANNAHAARTVHTVLNEMVANTSSSTARPTVDSYSAALRACKITFMWQRALQLLEEMSRAPHGPIVPDVAVYNACIAAMQACGKWEQAIGLVREMRSAEILPTVVSYHRAMQACGTKKGQHEHAHAWTHALALLGEMGAQRLARTVVSYTHVVHACGQWGAWECALKVLDAMMTEKEHTIRPDVVAYSAAISACEKGAQWERAIHLLDVMRDTRIAPNLVSYNAALSACEKGARWEDALHLLQSMPTKYGVVPDVISYNALISACGHERQWERAVEFLERMRVNNTHPNVISYNAVLSALAQIGRWEHALVLLDTMPCTRNIISYNATMSACAVGGHWKPALQLMMRAKQQQEDKPTATSYGALITACVNGQQHALACAVYRDAVRCHIFRHWRDEANYVVDFHDYIATVAEVALMVIMEDFALQPPTRDVVLIVGQGHHSKGGDPVELHPTDFAVFCFTA